LNIYDVIVYFWKLKGTFTPQSKSATKL